MGNDPGSIPVYGELIIILILTILNAFFAASEIAIVSVNKTRIKTMMEDGNTNAKMVWEMLKEPMNFLSTIQVGINLTAFLTSAAAAATLSESFSGFFKFFGLGSSAASSLSLITITVLLAFFNLIFGELIPKRWAMQNPEKVALQLIRPTRFFAFIIKPSVIVITMITNLFLRIMRVDLETTEERVSEEEIRSLLAAGQKRGVINATEKGMIDSIFKFDDKVAKEVMTPRTDVFAIDIEDSLEDFVDEMFDNMYSRIPVYEEDTDNIIGILYMKDFMAHAYRKGFKHVNIRSILKPVYFIPERKNIDVLFKEMQESKNHIAILLDEYGGFSGMVTIEDLVEEVMGEIDDEFDDDDENIVKLNKYMYIVLGSVNISDLNEELGLDLDEDSEDYDTVGGLVVHELDHIPTETGEKFTIDNLTFIVEAFNEKRVEKVKLIVTPTDE